MTSQHLTDDSLQSDAVCKTANVSRCVILHYHFYKNAGTSFDNFLQENFADQWRNHEGACGQWQSGSVGEYLQQNRDIRVLSSHKAQLPVPEVPDTLVCPVLFIRHPIDRVRSIYQFERGEPAGKAGTKMARKLDIASFIKRRLERKRNRSFRNFQTHRLSLAFSESQRRELGELECAQNALKLLPFVGLVEQFDASIERLLALLKPYYPNLTYRSRKDNVTQQAATTLEDRLNGLQEEIGLDLYDELVLANELDLAIHRSITSRYSA